VCSWYNATKILSGGFDFMARRKPNALPHIVLNIETKRPIELSDFVSAFSSIASQYEKFVRSEYPELAGDAKIYVREVRAGSIEADLIPWAMQGLSAVVNVIEQIQIVENSCATMELCSASTSAAPKNPRLRAPISRTSWDRS
jgi:hypothetical protein